MNRMLDLELITELVRVEGSPALQDDDIKQSANEAIKSKTFSKMERLERKLIQRNEEEEFLIMASKILVNQ